MKKTVFTILLLSLLVFTACEPIRSREHTLEKSEQIVIGFPYPFQMDSQIYYREGALLAVQQLNENGGIRGKTVRLLPLDDGGSITGGLKAAQVLVEDPSVVAVVGHLNSRVTTRVATVYNAQELIMITPASSAPDLMQPNFSLVFRTIPDDRSVVERMLPMMKQSGLDRVAIFYANDDFGRGGALAMEQLAPSYHVQVLDRLNAINQSNISHVLDRWRAFGVNTLVVAEAFDRSLEVIQMVRNRGFGDTVVGVSGLDFPGFFESLGLNANDVWIPTHFDPTFPDPGVEGFVDAFREAFGVEPDLWAALTYDTVMLLADAIERAQSFSQQAIAQQLHQTQRFPAVTGVLRCQPDGNFTGSHLFLKKSVDGQFQFVQVDGDGQ
ncbi:MAG TPA: ABC transporter substrate-binding protein [Thermotogota bacterium]|nr:ABC transporter substrate-binding protein [Thermotogota bacterium]